MHTENDTRTRDNTLALWGARHHSPAYYALRTAVRALALFTPLIAIHAVAYGLFPA